jgi:hypothetical protein
VRSQAQLGNENEKTENRKPKSLLQNVAAGFSLRRARLDKTVNIGNFLNPPQAKKYFCKRLRKLKTVAHEPWTHP